MKFLELAVYYNTKQSTQKELQGIKVLDSELEVRTVIIYDTSGLAIADRRVDIGKEDWITRGTNIYIHGEMFISPLKKMELHSLILKTFGEIKG